MAGKNPVATASPGASKNTLLKAIPDVDIDKGKFKYILVKVHDPAPDKSREYKHIVRGDTKASFHADIYDIVETAIEEKGLDCECVGGGRIDHDPGNKRIKIYGYSKGYGRADHSVTFLVLQKKFGSNYNITFSNEGY